jgi:hypothetical protein
MSLECTGTMSDVRLWPIRLCWKLLLRTRAFSSERLRRDTTWQYRTLKIVPGDELERAVRRDYREMQEMFFGEAPPFDEILSDLGELEAHVNSR